MGIGHGRRFFLLLTPIRSISSQRGGTRIAVVGSGPSGLFAVSSLLRRLPSSSIDVIEAAPVPFGLVRYGVAPDHQDVKNCIHSFEKMFSTHEDRLSLFCNLRVGQGPKEISLDDLRSRYSAILLAYGANRARRLNVPGSDSINVLTGSQVVGWYSGYPSSSPPLLDHSSAIVIGNGNVSLDCARVLASPRRLEHTDIPDEALELIRKSRVRNISIVGRRGPGDVSFTIKELREQFRLEGWSSGVEMDKEDEEKLRRELEKMERPRKRLMQVLLDNIREREGDHKCSLLFRRIPKEIKSDDNGRVKSVVFERPDGSTEEIEAGLVIASLGYEAVLLEGLPKNEKGELLMKNDSEVAMNGNGGRVFATGWCTGKARGVIADSQVSATRVATVMGEEIKEGGNDEGLNEIVRSKGIKTSGWKDWIELDGKEKLEGEKKGKIREKITLF
uniref:NADPH:adrenodoxin oxidoreductase, mitochondrial n=1 Tax=Pristionchus pacificus TaxID=54126 RepID=A0A8R1U3K5_PRIPA